jgi:flagellar basal-body rod modification protein FlgD
MNDLSISGIRTMEDLRAEAAAPKPEADLDRNAFLRLFTTQLQNQNPLDPMKNEAFVAQLAQFSSLEATTRMSDSLDQFVSTQSSEKIMRGASLIGKNVFASGTTVRQEGGRSVSGYVDLDQIADNVRLSVLDANTGQIVNAMDLGPQVAGEVGFDWNGGNFDGEAAPAGDYIFQAEVLNGDSTRGVPVYGQTRVQGVSFNDESGQVLVEISDGRTLALSDVTRITN